MLRLGIANIRPDGSPRPQWRAPIRLAGFLEKDSPGLTAGRFCRLDFSLPLPARGSTRLRRSLAWRPHRRKRHRAPRSRLSTWPRSASTTGEKSAPSAPHRFTQPAGRRLRTMNWRGDGQRRATVAHLQSLRLRAGAASPSCPKNTALADERTGRSGWRALSVPLPDARRRLRQILVRHSEARVAVRPASSTLGGHEARRAPAGLLHRHTRSNPPGRFEVGRRS